MKASLCILAHNGHEEAGRLVESIRAFRDLDLEIVVGEQACSSEALEWYSKNSDKVITVTDHDIWDRGFGYCRQKITEAASNNWIIAADCGEVWHENLHGDSLCSMVERKESPVFRVMRGDPETVENVLSGKSPMAALSDDNGRIFDRREMRWAGMIHEALFHIGTGESWASLSRRLHPVSLVEHAGSRSDSDAFKARKQVLYDHLIETIVHEPQKRFGTDHYWWTAYWQVVVKPRYREVSFEEWHAMAG